MLNAGVQDHLVRDGAHLLEQLLGLVALVFGEDGVGFWSGSLVASLLRDISHNVRDLNIPAAAIESGPTMPLISSSSTKDG